MPNAVQVYQALFSLATRDFPRAAALFLDSIATFTTCAHWSLTRCHIRRLAVHCALPDMRLHRNFVSC